MTTLFGLMPPMSLDERFVVAAISFGLVTALNGVRANRVIVVTALATTLLVLLHFSGREDSRGFSAFLIGAGAAILAGSPRIEKGGRRWGLAMAAFLGGAALSLALLLSWMARTPLEARGELSTQATNLVLAGLLTGTVASIVILLARRDPLRVEASASNSMFTETEDRRIETTSDRQGDRLRRWLKRGAGISTVGVVLWLAASLAVASRLISRARPTFLEPVPLVSWAAFEEVSLSTSDGERLGAWFNAGRVDLPAVLLLHGNGGCRSSCLHQAEILAREGCSVLLVTMRAHGDSTGEFNDFGYSARRDVFASVNWLRQRLPKHQIVVWGRSLGSAAAIYAALELGGTVDGFVLESPYRDLGTALRNRTDHYLPWPISRIVYSGLIVVAPVAFPGFGLHTPLNAAAGIRSTTPVLILAGTADQRARPDEANAIRDRIGGSAVVEMIKGGDHLQLQAADPTRYRDAIATFLNRVAGTRRSGRPP